jgi:hypothetical protein
MKATVFGMVIVSVKEAVTGYDCVLDQYGFSRAAKPGVSLTRG